MLQIIEPDWPAPEQVRSAISTRLGGVSTAPYDSLNLAFHVDDDRLCVSANRAALSEQLGLDKEKVCWLSQVHGTRIVTASHMSKDTEADGVDSSTQGLVCAVMTADCLPVLICNQNGSRVSAVHAGWRGLLDGVLASAVARFDKGDQLMAYLGPAISAAHFEVGDEVREGFVAKDVAMSRAFEPREEADKYFADLYELARIELRSLGVVDIYGGDFCTFADRERFYSYRRDGAATGRMASLIWLA